MQSAGPTYIWRKLVTPEWLHANEDRLDAMTNGGFAVISRPTHRRLMIEVASQSALPSRQLQSAFGGRSEKLSRDWLNEMLRSKSAKPIRVGDRLVIVNDERLRKSHTLVIPAGAAFGTGEHATTAMSLRLLERATRHLAKGWRMLDAGTGSGILAFAGRRFGAGEVIAVENNPLALATAKQNARLNKMRGVKLIEGDVEEHLADEFDVIVANMYSDLLITLLPRLRRALAPRGILILSGIMRTQERAVVAALAANKLDPVEIRRRGKWIALRAAFAHGKTRLTPRSAKRTLAHP